MQSTYAFPHERCDFCNVSSVYRCLYKAFHMFYEYMRDMFYVYGLMFYVYGLKILNTFHLERRRCSYPYA